MKKSFLAFVFLFASALSVNAQVQSSVNEQPKVVKAVAPKEYPSAAHITRAQSKITVEVEISAEGIVKTAKLLDGHKLFKKVSEDAAKKWQFNSIENKTAKRTAQINFVYVLIYEENQDSEISFNAPYEIEFRYKVSNVINSTRGL